MKQLTKLAILFAIILSLGCKKDDPTPVPPVIKFLDAQLSVDKTFSIVRFEFFDGDGDLGLKQEENTGEQAFNVFVDFYKKNNGIWVLDTTNLDARLPFLENESGRELEGETQISLLYDFSVDTFRYEISIKDRALHLSNIITTSELIP